MDRANKKMILEKFVIIFPKSIQNSDRVLRLNIRINVL